MIEPDDQGFHAYCPALKGLHAEGDTEQEALARAEEAAVAYLQSLIKNHEPIPLGAKVARPRSSGTAHTERLAVPVPA
ncbi:MAG TPA: type II toxin-antitoxin system HicB family antitoxin [Chloroflexota bacterium]